MKTFKKITAGFKTSLSYKLAYVVLLACYVNCAPAQSQDIYIGTSLGFADYLENRCGIVFKENGQPSDPFRSIANHGATMVRFHVGNPPYSNSYSEGQEVDHQSVESVKVSMTRAKAAGLKTMLTFTYQSFALEDEDNLNIFVAPLDWQLIASDLEKLTDSVYAYTYSVLDEYCAQDLVPEIVSIGNESSWHRLMPNVPENELPPYDPKRSVALHNAGSRAVRDIALKYDTLIKVCFHMGSPSATKWWLETHWPYGLDLDMIGISLYHGENYVDYAGYKSLGDFVSAIIGTYGIEFLVMETAQMFREGGNDDHVDIFGTELIPYGYPNPPTTETQKSYLIDITNEVLDHGSSGVLVWGGDWVGSDCYVVADRWGKGSSWENKAFWDFNYNLHDGVNWMMTFSGKVPITFKVDMSTADTSRGVFIAGDFENFDGKTWTPNRMQHEGNKMYLYTAYISPGTSGEFHFLNDTSPAARETVPGECSAGTELNRTYEIPANSSGEIFAILWSACDSITQYSLATSVNGDGFTSPVRGIYSSGVDVNLVARPGFGWRFENWTGDTSSNENPLLIRLNADMNLTANFIKPPKVPVTFIVDMTGVDVSNGVYVTGEFPGQDGKVWQLNPMYTQGGNIYSYSTQISLGQSGAYYFLNDDQFGVREKVPKECAVHWGTDRGYEIPANSSGEVFAFVWSSCREIIPVITAPNDTICDNTQTSIHISSLQAPALAVYYTYTSAPENAESVLGNGSDATGVPITTDLQETLDNQTDQSQKVVYTITPHVLRSDSSIGCTGNDITVEIWVEPTPTYAWEPVKTGTGPLARIFPNPVSDDKINILFYVAGNVNIRIMDVTGRIYYEQDVKIHPNNLHTIGLSSFTEGIYLLRLFFRGENTYHSKLIIIQDKN